MGQPEDFLLDFVKTIDKIMAVAELTCDCCGLTDIFIDLEDAFQKGWDAPPHFTGYVCCDRCPAFFAAGFAEPTPEHLAQHEEWKLESKSP